MALKQSGKLDNFRFGGPLVPKEYPGDLSFSPAQYLDSLDERNFRHLFMEWVSQCWLYSAEKIPKTEEEVKTFDLNSLVPEFKERYNAGDWKLITEGGGATIDEMTLCWQMKGHELYMVILNKDREPPPVLPEEVNYMFMRGELLLRGLLGVIAAASEVEPMVLIKDDNSQHCFNAGYYDQSRQIVGFKDNIGEKGKCFLSAEYNSYKIDAQFVGHTKKGDWMWEISLNEFKKVLYGVPLPRSATQVWNAIMLKKQEERYSEENRKKAFFKYYNSLKPNSGSDPKAT
jgi:hypothetical protein